MHYNCGKSIQLWYCGMPQFDSGWSNGKTLDEKCETEIALAWAVSAKNAFQNHSGHSPNELVFRSNINTPLVLTHQLTALEAATTNNMVKVNLNALHAVRKSFMEAESSEKIWEYWDLMWMKDLWQVTVSIIEDKTVRDGVVLLKYWLRKVCVYWLDMEVHFTGCISITWWR